ncbi:MAG: hypothetical protein KF833_13335 [Verrucomicrobiae bacterium]|nr:hypothetical protein [Verrucomicrobiae bacterium]
MNEPEFSRTDLADLQRQLVAWRHRQRGRPRLPEEVWTAAAALSSSLGVSRVSHALGLDFHKLRRRCSSPPAITPRAEGLPGFVELHLRGAVHHDGGPFRIELSGAHGARMTIALGHDSAAVVALAEAFWRRVP